MVEVAASTGAGIVCSHTGGTAPRTRPHRVSYPDIVADVVGELCRRAGQMVAAGVSPQRIVIDPTHDFGKNTYHGLALLRHCDSLVEIGWPVLMSLSHKDFAGETLDVDLAGRLEGTLAATTVAACAGARVFRVHDVAATRRTLEMVASVAGTGPPARAVRGLA